MLLGGGGGQRSVEKGKAENEALALCSHWHLNKVRHAALGELSGFEERTKRPGNLIC